MAGMLWERLAESEPREAYLRELKRWPKLALMEGMATFLSTLTPSCNWLVPTMVASTPLTVPEK